MTETQKIDLALTPSKLFNFLMTVAAFRPVFVWGPPGIGKSAIVEDVANHLGLPAVCLLGSQILPQDILGIPQMMDGTYRFAPPRMLARHEPYCLFLDEFNGSSIDVQKVFYNIISEKRIGEYKMPTGSIIIAAGNRLEDYAHVLDLSSALVNRMIHIRLAPNTQDWLNWAKNHSLHPLIIEYLTKNPTHLHSLPNNNQQPFSTPRTWNILSDAFSNFHFRGAFDDFRILCFGTLSPEHAITFIEFAKDRLEECSVQALFEERITWQEVEHKDMYLNFLIASIKNILKTYLPINAEDLTEDQTKILSNSADALEKLAEIRPDLAEKIIKGDYPQEMPAWFTSHLTKKIPSFKQKPPHSFL
ncbi:AAA family ATPase [Candidatus Nucleicultrix amoebiphila]|jgi:hypothetical protein|uniref:ATPase dynein-related AAA domain-containing protein n=1 Tax=Candidatus Nucleicultrix amoebiphila FS5 TaxID=1414854 RepID=A0A1W6N626_9PROT|nr:MoxR family ATPase [Candidatus Nucleicultrix amoebiphila]ARN85291.1 hypothetical protein GQ61_08315 [Candidatus Nucleicultrix amoebiphila FS5]